MSALFSFRTSALAALVLISVVLLGTTGIAAGAPPEKHGVTFRDAFGQTFERPVAMLEIPGLPEQYLVVEQRGALQHVSRTEPHADGKWAKSEFASFKVLGGRRGEDERGLLGLAFHPRFRENRRYYVNYIDAFENTVIVEHMANADVTKDSGTKGRVILKVSQPFENHNGGTIAFGPDGFLYVGMGDGGGAGDPRGHAQDPESLLGKMLRIDVNKRDEGKAYAVPPGNPFVRNKKYSPEIWALGLRNPWKWTFQPGTGALWVGDVGQRKREEISIVPRGGNMGWPLLEGDLCFKTEKCSRTGMVAPIVSLPRSEAASITGGEFFTANPRSLYHGAYVFGDYKTGSVWTLKKRKGKWERTKIGEVPAVSAFSRDSRGHIFALGLKDGMIRRIEFSR